VSPVLRRWHSYLLILLGISAVVWLAATAAGRFLPAPSVSTSPLAPECAEELAARLARDGLVAQVAMQADGTLITEVRLPASWPADQAAQAAWTVFDAVTDLPPTCTYQQLEVRVPAEGVRLRIRAMASDLQAWAEGTLDEASLVERVLYVREPLTPRAP
jgi:hypothetical protein